MSSPSGKTYDAVVIGSGPNGFAAAITVGWVLGNRTPKELLKSRTEDDHAHDEPNRFAAFFSHLSNDFFFMGRFVVLGGAIAALMQTAIPQSIVSGVASTPIIGRISVLARSLSQTKIAFNTSGNSKEAATSRLMRCITSNSTRRARRSSPASSSPASAICRARAGRNPS